MNSTTSVTVSDLANPSVVLDLSRVGAFVDHADAQKECRGDDSVIDHLENPARGSLEPHHQAWLFAAFLAAFAVKVPDHRRLAGGGDGDDRALCRIQPVSLLHILGAHRRSPVSVDWRLGRRKARLRCG